MPKTKERLYDTLTDEEIDIFGFFAERAVRLLMVHMLQWKQHFGFRSSKKSRETARTIAWAQYRQTMEATNIPVSEINGHKPPKNPESVERGKALCEIYDQIFPIYLQGDEYVDACRKTSSIMSMRTWAERKRREALKNALPSAMLIPRKPALTLSERRERWQKMLDERPDIQGDMGLSGTKIGVTETPITVLPPQTTVLEQHEPSREINLIMPEIVADADHQQQIHNEVYPTPRWMKRHRKRRKYHQH